MKGIGIFLLVGFSAYILLFGCGKNSTPVGSSSVSRDYRILANYSYVSDTYSDAYSMIFSTLTDSIIDSIYVPDTYHGMEFSNDGTILYQSRLRKPNATEATWSLDFETGDTLALNNSYGGERLSLSSDNKYLLVFPTLFELPTLTPIYVDSFHAAMDAQIVPNRHLAFVYGWRDTGLSFIDFSGPEIDTFFTVLQDKSGRVMNIQCVGNSISGDSLFIIADYDYSDPNYYFVVAGTDSLEILLQLEVPSMGFYSPCRPVYSPHDSRVFFYKPGTFFSFPKVSNISGTPGTLYSANLITHEINVEIDTLDFESIKFREVVITPDGRELYIPAGKIIRLRLADDEISVLEQSIGLTITNIAINPVDQSQ